MERLGVQKKIINRLYTAVESHDITRIWRAVYYSHHLYEDLSIEHDTHTQKKVNLKLYAEIASLFYIHHMIGSIEEFVEPDKSAEQIITNMLSAVLYDLPYKLGLIIEHRVSAPGLYYDPLTGDLSTPANTAIRLPEGLNALFKKLFLDRGEIVPYEELLESEYWTEKEEKALRQNIYALRERLRCLGIPFTIQSDYSNGYKLTMESGKIPE